MPVRALSLSELDRLVLGRRAAECAGDPDGGVEDARREALLSQPDPRAAHEPLGARGHVEKVDPASARARIASAAPGGRPAGRRRPAR